MSLPAKEIYAFGPFRVDAAEQLLLREGQPIPLTPKVFETLLVLLRHHGHLVTKDDLMKLLWPDSFVEESSLTRNISVLRKALGSGAEDSSFIETVPRRGYRFRAPVEVIQAPVPALVLERQVETRIVQEEEEIEETTEPRPESWRLVAAVSVVLVLVGAGLVWQFWPRAGPALPPMRVAPFATFQTGVQTPSFSPDGARIAFARWDGPEANWNIYVKTIGADPPLQLTSGPGGDLAPTWSPDGSRVAFLRDNIEGSGIYVVGSLGGAERKLLQLVPNRYFDLEWSPDGRLLIFAEKTNLKLGWDSFQSLAIFTLDVEKLEKRQVTFPAEGFGDDRFALSPDGQTLAFVRREETHRLVASIWKVSLAGGSAIRIYDEQNWIGHLAWTPDGDSIVFTSDREGGSKLFRLPSRGGTPEPLPYAEHEVAYPAVSRTGNRLAYVRDYQTADLWRTELVSPRGPGKPPAPFHRSVRLETAPEFSPDGRSLAYFSEESGRRELWICDADGKNARPLTDFNAAGHHPPSWAPDGKEIVFAARFGPANSPGGIFSIRMDTREVRRLADSSYAMPTWSRDGKWIYVSLVPQRGVFELWKLPVSGGAPVHVTSDGCCAQESADGKLIYFGRNTAVRGGGIWGVPISGGAESAVLPDLSDQLRGFWRIVDDGIFYVFSFRPDEPTLMFFDFAAQRKIPIAKLPGGPTLHHGGLTVSPDRRWIVYSQVSRSASDIMLVENFR